MSSARSVPAAPSQPRNASFDDTPELYDEMRASGHMARRRREFFLQAVDQTPGRVLEVGCGTGALLRQIAAERPDRQFTGIEPLANYVEYAGKMAASEGRSNLVFAVGTGETLGSEVADESIGLTFSVDTLHHVDDIDQVAREIARVTAPGGRWRVMEPNRIHPYVWAYHTFTEGERTFNARDFLRRARAAGWQVLARQNVFIYPSGVTSVPRWAAALERGVERFRPLSGGLIIDLVRPVTNARAR